LPIQNRESLLILLFLGILTTLKRVFLILCQFCINNFLHVLNHFLRLLVGGIWFLMISCDNTELILPIENLTSKTRVLTSYLCIVYFDGRYFIVQRWSLVINSDWLVTVLYWINFKSIYLRTLFINIFIIYLIISTSLYLVAIYLL
jgi:hypothetical protein